MKFHYRYEQHSVVSSDATQSDLSFAPDLLRKPVHMDARIRWPLAFREAISALHEVVTSDLRTQPQDRSAYREWLAQNEDRLLLEFAAQGRTISAELAVVEKELTALRSTKAAILKPFYTAQKRYFDWLYQTQRELWFLLDPVISVFPDGVQFECFSNDESSYASLSLDHDQLECRDGFACGTTNIDYSDALYTEFQKLRDYRSTRLNIATEGLTVQHAGDDALIEHKIDVPDSWVRGFLQVSSAMTLPMNRLRLHPMDLHNLCFRMRQRRERHGPRSLRLQLEPGKPGRILIEPWNQQLDLPRSMFEGSQAMEVRLWGRRRLLTLERLIPYALHIDVLLLGTGLPSFWIVQLPGMRFTLGLSGWTANDWSRIGQFDLLAPRGEHSSEARLKVYEALGRRWFGTAPELAADTGLPRATVESCLSLYAQQGRVMYDLGAQVYRLRELSGEPLPFANLRFASELEAEAVALVQGKAVRKLQCSDGPQLGERLLTAQVKQGSRTYAPQLLLDADQRLAPAGCVCQCDHFVRNKLMRGPCTHMIAVRLMADAARAEAA